MKLPQLYKRSAQGKISTWQIEFEDNKYRTISGFYDGIKTTSAWTECEGKTYNNVAEQTEKQARALHKKKIELGAFESIDDIDEPVFFKPMLAKDYNDEKDKIKFPIYSQPKLDGVRCIITSQGMFSRNGKKIISAPHIYESLKPLFEENPDLILDGELFAQRSETIDFNKIISCVRKTKPTKEDLDESKKYIEYWIYDIPSDERSFGDRYQTYHNLNLPKCCNVVFSKTCKSEEDVMEIYKQYIEQGFEGQILRVINSLYENKRSKSLLKYKEFFDGEYEIKGVEEGKGKLQGKVGKLVFDGFDSAVNGDHEYLEKLYKSGDLIGKMATVKYFELTTDNKPRFPKVIAIRDFE